jgi:uncharacterized protein
MKARAAMMALGLGFGLVAGDAAGQVRPEDMQNVPLAASYNQTARVAQLLATQDVDADAIDGAGGRTALGYAASFNNTAMAQLLFDHGARVDARDGFGNTALHWAAENGSMAMMYFLIARRATIDAANRQGITPLMVATDHAQPKSMRLLIENGADPHKQDFTGRDAFGWAAGKPAMLQTLQGKQ